MKGAKQIFNPFISTGEMAYDRSFLFPNSTTSDGVIFIFADELFLIDFIR
ncbi:MAG: hypothetical protein HOB52_05235 [Euryarchaeota archaeon]|nr:hypothetical protein [Euryarchaeota archaeon]